MPETPASTQVLVNLRSVTELPPDKVSLKIDVATMKDDDPAPNEVVIFELDGEVRKVTTSEKGRAKDDIVFKNIKGVRRKLKVWAQGSEENISEYEVSTPEEEKTEPLVPEQPPKEHEVSKEEAIKILLQQEGRLIIKNGQELVLTGETYEINRDITVDAGGKLIIQPGAVLRFGIKCGIACRGQLQAKGTPKAPITFTRQEEGKNWKNITFETDETVEVENVFIEYGGGRHYKLEPFGINAVIDHEPGKEKHTEGGGAVFLTSCNNTIFTNVTVQHCITKREGAEVSLAGHGGGIWIKNASPQLFNVRCSRNRSMFGGGLHVDGGNVQINNLLLEKNHAQIHGGGLAIIKGNPTIHGVTIDQNTSHSGAGLFLTGGKETMPKIKGMKLTENVAAGNGGAANISIYYDGTNGVTYHPSISDVTNAGNRARGTCGGIYITHGVSKSGHEFFMRNRHDYPHYYPFAINNIISANNHNGDIENIYKKDP